MKQYFTIAELCYSDTAEKYKIDNTPSLEVAQHLNELIAVLNPIREAWGSGIRVTSGYRCEKLNKMIGGSKTSAHMTGYGVDLFPVNGNFNGFKKFIVDYLKDKLFDQCIIEKSGRSQWIHFGLKNAKGLFRKMIFNITK